MKKQSGFLFVLLLAALGVHAAERKPLKDVDIGALTTETQLSASAEGVHLVWWIPREFWQVSALSEGGGPDTVSEIDEMMSKYSMLAIAQAEISPFGQFKFYDREKISQGLKIEFTDAKGKQVLQPLTETPEELQMLLKVMGPMLEGAMGNMGKNMSFFVLSDETKKGRIVSPYEAAKLAVTLADKTGPLKPVEFEFPLNALFVPRMCPNGKPAHVTWVVCPWDGSKLPQ